MLQAGKPELQELRDFIDSRCEDEVVGGMEECYDLERVNLTIDIVGLGEVEINTVDYTPDMVPATAWYFAEVPMILEAEEDLGEGFLYWEVVSGDVTVADLQDPILPLTLTGDAHLVAHFGTPVPPEDVTFSVEPPIAGYVVLDGMTLVDYPSTQLLDVGAHNLSTEPNSWWEFSHWTWQGNAIGPDASAFPAELNVFEAGSVVAHFRAIPHTNLTVEVIPAEAGSVRVMDMAWVDDIWTKSFEPNGPVGFEAISEEEWEFSHWEVLATQPLPQEKANPMSLVLEGIPNEVVKAHFAPVEFRLFVPNAFTPDNDGVNDAFHPLGSGFKAVTYSFMVFNRWGELVYVTDDAEEPWIGQNNQRHGTHFVPDGVYGYRVEAKGYHEIAPTVLRGTVTVVR